jgi:hypothetical protein
LKKQIEPRENDIKQMKDQIQEVSKGRLVWDSSKTHLLCIEWNFSKPVSTGTKNYGWFRGVADFMRLLLQRINRQGLKKSADIQGGPVFWGSGLEKFHYIYIYIYIYIYSQLSINRHLLFFIKSWHYSKFGGESNSCQKTKCIVCKSYHTFA